MARRKKAPKPTEIAEIDRLAAATSVTLGDYIEGVSAYVRAAHQLSKGSKKASQIRLSNALARALAHDLSEHIPTIRTRLCTEEQEVAGALRTTNADVSEPHQLDGLRLAIEIKPVNLAVGRAIWNRFGDIRTFAVNIHLKFPFAVVGGVLAIPTYEVTRSRASGKAPAESNPPSLLVPSPAQTQNEELPDPGANPGTRRRSTLPLIDRAVRRLVRAGGRHSEADAAHLLEAICVLVYDPDTAAIDTSVPPVGSRLRWNEFVEDLASSYLARFED